eukprot:TRINITY_DN1020_c2_g1_i1.p1 TRINITY_DN1020_c2_g1~~TRINITY_DN1020_c2_g1_i1.p1  ORF type:complete len:178 (+),score=54.34 TRINITY_DN1020_c2_g1_i1:112-645(+)
MSLSTLNGGPPLSQQLRKAFLVSGGITALVGLVKGLRAGGKLSQVAPAVLLRSSLIGAKLAAAILLYHGLGGAIAKSNVLPENARTFGSSFVAGGSGGLLVLFLFGEGVVKETLLLALKFIVEGAWNSAQEHGYVRGSTPKVNAVLTFVLFGLMMFLHQHEAHNLRPIFNKVLGLVC